MKKDQEEHLRWEREEVERMRKKNEEQAEKMKKDQDTIEPKLTKLTDFNPEYVWTS
jgi:hypothetical protein